ncbi:hypothetical protein DF185_01340 [Marinifilum breve]|uniref:YcxB-like C-terminal domain-containing protein n=1 Tax=Marinifilum breve TaxID=2184082 RepID=A0A2V4A1K3_9BACT|nr:YcxB family protein [Marinifilum breve]PXY02765.1 hypothetical protein DF185_01340 [Marinifilum breve]
MIIETKIEFKKYVKLMYQLTYKKPSIIFISIVGIFLLVLSIQYFIGINTTTDQPPYVQLFIGLIVLFIPYSVYRSSKRSFKTNSRLQETITYEFTQDKIRIKGESFDSVMDWTKLHKIVEMKDWILLYQNKLTFNLIPKISFGKKIEEFRSLAKGQEGLQTKLKR